MMMLSFFALAAAAAVQEQPRGDRLKPVEQCFAITRNTKDGPQTVGATKQVVRAVTENGAPAWDIVVAQKIPGMFDMRDHFVLSRRDLRPIRFDSQRNGVEHVALRYANNRVTGTKRAKDGTSITIDQSSATPYWEGNLWGITFGALPLAANKHLTLPFYQYDKGFGAFDLTVAGSETVKTPTGSVPAWTVDVTAGSGPTATYLIAKETGQELGTRSAMFGTTLGGDCSAIR